MNTRLLNLTGMAALVLAPITAAQAAEISAYPTRPIRIIVPTTPGGPPDITARLVAEKIAAPLGRPVIVENRPGASFTLGLSAVAKATPDGYTLGLIPMPATVSPSLIAKLPYDTEKDLAAVSLVAWSYNILAVPAASPAKSLSDLIAAAKAKPGALKFSSGGNGTPAHLAGELFKREAKVELVHIPYKGAAAGSIAVLTGDVDMMIGATGVLTAHVKSGKLRGLATPASQRLAAYPELPTFIELGYPRVQIREWHGVVVPTGSPRGVIERLYVEIAKAVALPDTKQRFEPLGLEPAEMPPAVFAAHIRDELRKWAQLVRESGIKAD
jgi:tripartite-type tricarboxylate transporter receptor subunit TctC